MRGTHDKQASMFSVVSTLDKWLDHVQLERQVRILERHGLVVTSQTLWDLAYAVAQRLSLVDGALMKHVLEQPVIGLDQTGWPRLETDATKPWQMWALTAPGVVVHRIRDDKSAATFGALVGAYNGVIIADALGTHEAGARASPGIVLAGCCAHVYRRFVEAEPDHPDNRARDPWPRRRAQEPLRLEIAAWHRGRVAALHDPRNLQAARRRPAAYLHAAVIAADRGDTLLPWQFAAQS